MFKLATLVLGFASVFAVVILFHAVKLHKENKLREESKS